MARGLAGVVVVLGVFGCGPGGGGPDGGLPDGGAAADGGCPEAPVAAARNLLDNPGFECGGAEPPQWKAIRGTVDFTGAGVAGRAARLTVDAAGGRLAYALDVGVAAEAGTWCARAWVRGTVPYMRLVLLTPTQLLQSTQLVTGAWKHMPFAWAQVAAGERVQLYLEAQTNRDDGDDARPGQVLEVDSVSAWISRSGWCDER